jgi:hypothetical protein
MIHCPDKSQSIELNLKPGANRQQPKNRVDRGLSGSFCGRNEFATVIGCELPSRAAE